MAGSCPEISLSARATSRSRFEPGKMRTADFMTVEAFVSTQIGENGPRQQVHDIRIRGSWGALGDQDRHQGFAVLGDDERDRAPGRRLGAVDRERAHASRHVAERDRPPRSQRPRRAAQKFEIGQPIDFRIVRYPLEAVAEAALDADEEPRVEPATLVRALERLSGAPFVEQKRPAHLGPGRLRASGSGPHRRSGRPRQADQREGEQQPCGARKIHPPTSMREFSMMGLAKSFSAASLSSLSARPTSSPSSSMSNTLPWRTLATPARPSALSAPSIALPCGSSTPDFKVTVTPTLIPDW